MSKSTPTKSLSSYLWDLWCIVSIVGIWPRFIEPTLLEQKKCGVTVSGLKKPLKIAFFSDLHWNSTLPKSLLTKLHQAIEGFDPDLILLGGDFICEGEVWDKEGLLAYLNRFSAKKGLFAILGNHDYNASLSINEAGDYDITSKGTPFLKAISRLFKLTSLTGKITDRARSLAPHSELIKLLTKSPFTLLDNKRVEVDGINIVGLEEYMAGKALPKEAFKNYNPSLPGVVLVHNPDMIPKLSDYPGDIFLSGHTHGGQVNLPFIWRRLTAMEDFRFKTGKIQLEKKTAFVSRGIGSLLPFRWRARPEVILLTLRSDG